MTKGKFVIVLLILFAAIGAVVYGLCKMGQNRMEEPGGTLVQAMSERGIPS